MLFSIPIYTFFVTDVPFNDISSKSRHYFSCIFSIFVLYQLYLIRLSEIDLNAGLNPILNQVPSNVAQYVTGI